MVSLKIYTAYKDLYSNQEMVRLRKWIIENYDPYTDGRCAERMLKGAKSFIERYGVPSKRKLNLWRKYVSVKTFGKIR